MRIYELAKKYNILSKELLDRLREAGFELSSHMVIASDSVVDYVERTYGPSHQKKAKNEKITEAAGLQGASPSQGAEKKAQQSKPEELVIQSTRNKGNMLIDDHAQHRGGQGKVDVYKQDVFVEDEIASLLNYEIDTQIGKSFTGGKFKSPLDVDVHAQGYRPGRRRKRRRSLPAVEHDVVLPNVTEVVLEKDLPVVDVAALFGKNVGDIVLQLLKKGLVCSRNNIVPLNVIQQLADNYGIQVVRRGVGAHGAGEAPQKVVRQRASNKGATRWPVVVVMGHVDHGKTSLLDYVRKMNVAAGEKGGITQHLGAYEVDSAHGKIIFLDTPGHEAFSYIRQKGTSITDIVVLVVAADDGVKPQTVEAIKHAKQAQVPIVVAINKIDKVSSQAAIETIKRQLAQHDLMPEDWGGQTVCVPISAKTGQGVDELLEMIVLQSQLMELAADPKTRVRAFVLESRQERGLGFVATIICAEGTLKLGDYFACGQVTGKVRLLINSQGKRIKEAGPSLPVRVVGFDAFMGIGDWLETVDASEYAKKKAVKFDRNISVQQDKRTFGQELTADVEHEKSINLIIKTDTRGSYEALISSLDKISKKHKDIHCPIVIVSGGVGDITEGDIELADNTQSRILALHVKPEKNALVLAKDKNVRFEAYDIIYNLIDDVEKMLLSKKVIVKTWKKIGKAVVRKVFNMKGVGVIAGCYMAEGTLNRQCKVVCVRQGQEIGEGKITSLQRDKKHVKEVHAGFECGFLTDSFHDWQEGDSVVCLTEAAAD